MSSTVDSRVVEMRFDNSHFERNVSTTMSTLDKLKQKLNLSGASKGLEDVNAAAKHVDMSSLGGAVDTVKAKFSALDIVAITALTNITNSAVNAGKKLVSSLTIDQVTSGWGKFSDKTKSVATLVAQGNAIEDVNAQLSRLNWYTDETSYNFTDMVSNIAKFTATGKGLEESVTAMEGIANWAAVSGQNAATASRAMYQLSQAMGAGVLRLEDYKSIQNASMDTEEFRQKCIDAAIELKTLKKVGNDTYRSLVATGKAGANAFNISQFTTHLTDGAWLTSEVMMKVFNDYSAAVNGIYEAAEEKGMLASEIIDEIHTTAEQAGISTDEAIKKLGYSFDSFALKAFEAAQKARTFEDAIDSVKDAVSTGWMNTFELIFGDAEGATKLWTDVANQLYDIFATGGERRNEILTDAMLPKWDQLITRINDAGIETDTFEKKIIECAKAGGVNVDDLIKKYGSLSDVFKNGKLDTDYLKEALDKLTGANEETAKSTESVGKAVKGLSVDFTNIFPGKYGERTVAWGSDAVESVKKVQTALTELGYSLPVYGIDGIFERETWEAVAAFQKDAGLAVTGIVDQKTIDAMVKAGESLERVGEAAEGTGNKLKGTKVEIDDLVDGISHLSGRELVFNTIHNTLEGIVKIISTFRDAWADVFPTNRVASGLHSFLEMIHSVSEAFILSDNNAKKLQSTFKGVIAIFDILTSIVGGALKAAFDVIGAVFDTFGFNVLTITSNIGDVISAFRDWLVENELISKVFGKVVDGAKAVIDIVKSWVNAFTNIPIVKKVLFEIQRAFTRFSLSAKDMDHAMKKVVEWLKSLKDLPIVQKILEKLQSAFTSFIDYLPVGISKLKEWFDAFKQTDGVQHLISAVEDLIDAFKKLFNGEIDPFEFATMLGDSLGRVLRSLSEILDQFTSKFTKWFDAFKQTDGVQHLISAVEDLIDAFKKLFNGEIDFSEFGTMLVKGLGSALISLPEIALQLASDFIAGFQNGLADGVSGVISKIVEFCTNFISAFKAALGIHSPSVIAYEDGVNFIQGFINGLKSMVGAVIDFLKEIGEKIIEFFKGIWDKVKAVNDKIDWNKVFAVGMLIGAALFIKKIADVFSHTIKLFDSAAGVLDSVKNVIKKFGGVLDSFSKVLDNIALDYKAKAMIKIAAAIAILVAAILAIVYVAGDDYGKLWNAVGVVAVLAIIIAGLAFAMSKISASSMSIGKNGINVDGLKTAVLQIGIAIALIAFAVKMLGNLDEKTAKDGFTRLSAIAVGMLAFMGTLSLISPLGKNVDKFGGTMIKLLAAILIMIYVIKKISGMDPTDIIIGVIVMEAFILLMIQLGIANRLAGQNGDKFGGNVLKVSVAMGIMVLVMKMLSGMDPGDIAVGIAVLEAFVILMLEMAVVNRVAGKNNSKFGSAIMGMAASMVILTGVIWLLSKLDESAVENGIKVMQKFVLLIAELTIVSRLAGKEKSKVAGNILAMSVAIGVLAAIAWVLGTIPIENLKRGIAAISVLGLVMAAMVRACKGANEIKGSIYAMAAVITILTLAVYALTTIDDGQKLAGAVAAIGSLMLIFGLMAKLATSSTLPKGTISSLVAMAGVVILLSGILLLLCSLKIDNALEVASSLSMMMLAFAASFKIMSTIGSISKSAYGGMAAMVAVLAVVAIIIGLLASFDVGPTLEIAQSLSMVLLALSASCFILAAGATIMALASTGILGMVAVILVMGVLMAAIAGLATWQPGLESFLSKSLPILNLLGQGIGEFLGGIIAAVGNAYLGLLEQLGTSLSNFMSNVQPFLNGAKDIDSSVLAGVGYLTAAIVALGVADFIAGLASLLTFGQGSFSTIGQGLAQLGEGATAFFNATSSIGSDAVEAAKNVAAMILALSASSLIDAITTLLGGSTDYTSLGNNLKTFGEAVVGFSDIVSGKIDSGAVESAANAGLMLAKLNESLPRSGGLAQDLLGEQDLTTFSSACKAFADCMVDISASLNQEGFEIPSEKIEQLSKAGTQFATLNSSLPRKGGLVQDLLGEQDLTAFGTACKAFATCMIGISKSLSGDDISIESDKLSQLATAGTQFATLNSSLPRKGGVLQDYIGEQDLTAFGTACKAFATCMININDSLASFSIDTSRFESLAAAGNSLLGLQDTLPKSGGWWQTIAGEQDIGDFGNKIKTFGTAMSDFGKSLGDFDTTKIDLAISVARRIKTFAESCNELNTDGIDTFIYDGVVSGLGTVMSNFNEAVADINVEAVSTAVTAATRLKSLINSLADLKTTGVENFKPDSIGKSIKAYSDSVAGFDIEAVTSSITAAGRLKSLINSLVDLDNSGITMFTPVRIGNSIKAYANSVAGIDLAAIISSVIAANRIKSLINSLVDLDNSGIAKFTPISIGKSIKGYSDAVSGINLAAISNSIIAASKIRSFISSLSSLKTTGVSSFSSAVNELSQVNFSGISSTIDSYAETMQTSGQTLMTNLSAGVQAGLGGLITAVNGALTKAVGNIRSRVGLFRSSGAALARGAASGFSSNIGSLTSAASSAASTAASSIRGYRSSFFSAGEYLVRGFANGITLYTYIAEQAAKNMANKAAESAKSALQQHSPSRVFMEIGKYTVKGFAIGLNSLGNEVEDSAGGMAAKAITTTRTAMATMLDTLNSDMDAQPTIKPVIDLSDVRTGVDAISGMFTGSQTIGVRSNIDAINMAMNDTRQNGGNRDVVSAINKLGDGLENVKGDTYNFGGFTYDDGSNVSDAVETLIRYARIGRRR